MPTKESEERSNKPTTTTMVVWPGLCLGGYYWAKAARRVCRSRKRPLAGGVAEECDDEVSWDEVAQRTKRRNSQGEVAKKQKSCWTVYVPGKAEVTKDLRGWR